MGRELQKKKNRSSLNKVKPSRKKKHPRQPRIKSFGSQIIADNWNKKETLSQNYKRLGLAVKLNKPTGGVEIPLSSLHNPHPTPQPSQPAPLAAGEARIERDPDGNIIRIVYGKSVGERLDELEETNVSVGADVREGKEETTEVVKQLIERANRGVKVERDQSERETEWVKRLVEKYGDDYKRMAWDRKLNPFQQSEGDIKKRVLKFKQKMAKKQRAEVAASA